MDQPHVFVRPATTLDAGALGTIQAKNMRTSIEAFTGESLDESVAALVTAASFASAWKSTLAEPVESGVILSAVSEGVVVGFAAGLIVESPPNGTDVPKENGSEGVRPTTLEITAFEISGPYSRKGHGSRLLAAIADHAREHGVSEIATWILADDDARVRFFRSAGLGPAGLRRSLEVGRHELTEHRWYAKLV